MNQIKCSINKFNSSFFHFFICLNLFRFKNLFIFNIIYILKNDILIMIKIIWGENNREKGFSFGYPSF
jgi:hypothetical protein